MISAFPFWLWNNFSFTFFFCSFFSLASCVIHTKTCLLHDVLSAYPQNADRNRLQVIPKAVIEEDKQPLLGNGTKEQNLSLIEQSLLSVPVRELDSWNCALGLEHCSLCSMVTLLRSVLVAEIWISVLSFVRKCAITQFLCFEKSGCIL